MLKIKPNKADDIDVAIDLVLELAFQNIVDRFDSPSEYRRQMAAYKLVKSTLSKSGD